MLWNHARVAFTAALAASVCASGTAAAQVADCDIAQGKIDVLVKLSHWTASSVRKRIRSSGSVSR